MPMNNISLCFRSTKSPPSLCFVGFLLGVVFFPFQAGFTFCSGSFFQSSIVRERKRTPSKSCHFGETPVLSVLSTHTVPVRRGCPSRCPQPLPEGQDSLSLQIQGRSFWAQTWLLGSGSPVLRVSEVTSVMQLQSPQA